MAFETKYSRLLSQEDFDQLNNQYHLNLQYEEVKDYRHAQIIWNLHCKVEELHQEVTVLKKNQKRLKNPES